MIVQKDVQKSSNKSTGSFESDILRLSRMQAASIEKQKRIQK